MDRQTDIPIHGQIKRQIQGQMHRHIDMAYHRQIQRHMQTDT